MFPHPKPVIAMVHVGALPGTPAGGASMRELEQRAVEDARIYRDAGVHGIAIENMHDVPYLRGGVGPEIVAAMTVLACAVKQASSLPCGLQILAGANREALAVAHAAALDFVRVEGFAFAHVADEGIIESSAAPLLRFRRQIGAERVQVWADVKKKHASHAITNLARYWDGADGFIVGSHFERDGRWSEGVDVRRVERFMEVHGAFISPPTLSTPPRSRLT